MGIKIGMNMSLRNQTPLDDRQLFEYLSDMVSFPETSLPDGIFCYCKEDKNTYQFNSNNDVDPTTATGKWRIFVGSAGLPGEPGKNGKSAYEIWLDSGNEGTISDFLFSLQGFDGDDGNDGINGKSSYELWLELGNEGTETDYFSSLKGDKGDPGIDGESGANGEDGKSVYDLWLEDGNDGTLSVFISSLKGDNGYPGIDGESSYELWLELGNEGTESEFLESLKANVKIWQGTRAEYEEIKDTLDEDTIIIFTDSGIPEEEDIALSDILSAVNEDILELES